MDRFCFKKNPEDFFQLHILGFEADGLHGSTRHTCKVGAGTGGHDLLVTCPRR